MCTAPSRVGTTSSESMILYPVGLLHAQRVIAASRRAMSSGATATRASSCSGRCRRRDNDRPLGGGALREMALSVLWVEAAGVDRGAHGRLLRPLRTRVENREQQIDERLGDDRFVREPHVGDDVFAGFDENEASAASRCCARRPPAWCDCVPCTATPRWSSGIRMPPESCAERRRADPAMATVQLSVDRWPGMLAPLRN